MGTRRVSKRAPTPPLNNVINQSGFFRDEINSDSRTARRRLSVIRGVAAEKRGDKFKKMPAIEPKGARPETANLERR